MYHIIVRGVALVGLVVLALLLFLTATHLLTPLIAVLLLAGMLGTGIVVARLLYRIARLTPFSSGQERFLNQQARTITDLTPAGRVRFHGENWAAVLDDPFAAEHVPAGTSVRVVGVADLRLIVAPSVDELVDRARNRSLADPHSATS